MDLRDDADRVAGAGRDPAVRRLLLKDEILGEAFSRGYRLFYAVGIVVAFMTAFYTFRMVFMTFAATWRGPAEPGNTSTSAPRPWSCRCMILAIPTALVGLLLGIPPESGLSLLAESVFSCRGGTARASSRLARRHGA